MTQFQPPPIPPGGPPTGALGDPGPVPRAPTSAAAVTGFVCSLLGCAGVTAVVGLVFGIIGITKTRDGVRRGRGLAIAAIPISVVTGIGSIVIAIGAYAGFGMLTSTARITAVLPKVLAGDPAQFTNAEAALRPLCSDSFNEDVSSEALHAWLGVVAKAHGKLTKIPTMSGNEPSTMTGYISWELSAPFDNGTAAITLRLVYVGTAFQLDDIQIAGVSPRGP